MKHVWRYTTVRVPESDGSAAAREALEAEGWEVVEVTSITFEGRPTLAIVGRRAVVREIEKAAR